MSITIKHQLPKTKIENTQVTEVRPHAWQTQDVSINAYVDSLASFGNPNSIRFSPGNGGATPSLV